MKFLTCIAILLIGAPLQAQLLATFETSEGDVVVELQYEKAPMAVANFMTLAQGTRLRLDAESGSLTDAPLYVGELFFRVVNDTGFKIAQTGSGTGTNSGGPGFTFKDEFDAELLHEPYVLSMANSGPNSNGSQIYFTGNVTIPGLDFRHTVFGKITDPGSRLVIDAILAAGDDGAGINGVSFSREDAAAEAFDEHAQGLPMLGNPRGRLAVEPGSAATWHLDEPMGPGTILTAYSSETLESGSWSALASARMHVGLGDPDTPPAVDAVELDDGSAAKRFYKITLAEYPGSVVPSSLAGRTVELKYGDDSLIYTFDASEDGGTASYIRSDDPDSPLDFDFDLFDFSKDPHQFWIIVDNGVVEIQRYLRIRVVCDTASDVVITGRHVTQIWNGSDWEQNIPGHAEVSR